LSHRCERSDKCLEVAEELVAIHHQAFAASEIIDLKLYGVVNLRYGRM